MSWNLAEHSWLRFSASNLLRLSTQKDKQHVFDIQIKWKDTITIHSVFPGELQCSVRRISVLSLPFLAFILKW